MSISVVVEMDNGAIISYDPTFLNFSDEYTFAVDLFDPGRDIKSPEAVRESGIKVHRKAFKKSSKELISIDYPRTLVAPEDVPNVSVVEVNGVVRLMNDGWGNLIVPGAFKEDEDEELTEVEVVMKDGSPIVVDQNGEIVGDVETLANLEDMIMNPPEEVEEDDLMALVSEADADGFEDEEGFLSEGLYDVDLEEGWTDDDYSG